MYGEVILAEHMLGLPEKTESLLADRINEYAESLPIVDPAENMIVIAIIESAMTPAVEALQVFLETANGKNPVWSFYEMAMRITQYTSYSFHDFTRFQLKSLERSYVVLKNKGYHLSIVFEFTKSEVLEREIMDIIKNVALIDEEFKEAFKNNDVFAMYHHLSSFIRSMGLLTILRDNNISELIMDLFMNDRTVGVFTQFGSLHRYLPFALNSELSFNLIDAHFDSVKQNINCFTKYFGVFLSEYFDVKDVPGFDIRSFVSQFTLDKLEVIKDMLIERLFAKMVRTDYIPESLPTHLIPYYNIAKYIVDKCVVEIDGTFEKSFICDVYDLTIIEFIAKYSSIYLDE